MLSTCSKQNGNLKGVGRVERKDTDIVAAAPVWDRHPAEIAVRCHGLAHVLV